MYKFSERGGEGDPLKSSPKYGLKYDHKILIHSSCEGILDHCTYTINFLSFSHDVLCATRCWYLRPIRICAVGPNDEEKKKQKFEKIPNDR